MSLFVLSNLVPTASWLSDIEECAFVHLKKPTCPGNKVANASFTCNNKKQTNKQKIDE